MAKRGMLAMTLAALLAAAPLTAQTIDQSQTVGAALYVGRTGSDACSNALVCGSQGWFTQSFRPTATTSAGAAFYLTPVNQASSGTLLVDLWDMNPGLLGATKLAGGSTSLGSLANYYTVWFNSVASVVPGSQYFLAFYSDAPYTLGANYGNSYTAGDLNYNRSTVATDAYVGNQCCDARFIEYSVGPAVPPTVVAPEPASVVLMAAGLIVVAAMSRRLRKSSL